VQPMFWVEIYRVAEGLGTRSPDEVLLFPDTTAAATGHRTWLGLRPGVRRLHLGLPLLAGLTERELRAVIAHAFCRSWGHASLARVNRLGQEIVGRVADMVGEGWVVGRYVGRYRRTYDALSDPFIRRHELAVDRLCADFAGNNATAAAFSEVAVLKEGWAAFVDGYAKPAAAVGRRPDDIFAGFTSFLQEPGRRQQLAEAAGASASERPWAGDSQLSIADRLAAIAALPEDDIHDRFGPALGLMRYPDQVIHHVEEAMFGGAEFLPETWEDILPEAARAGACEDAQHLARLAHEGGLGAIAVGDGSARDSELRAGRGAGASDGPRGLATWSRTSAGGSAGDRVPGHRGDRVRHGELPVQLGGPSVLPTARARNPLAIPFRYWCRRPGQLRPSEPRAIAPGP